MIWIYVILGIIEMDLVAATGTVPGLMTYCLDACSELGSRSLSCDDGHVINIRDVKCVEDGHNYTCAEKEKLVSLCNGLKSCSNIDLNRQLHYFCKDYPRKNVTISFQCVKEQTKPLCRTNVCGTLANDEIKCQRGKVFHLLDAKCYHGKRDCSSDVYMAIYRVCENQRMCSIVDIRTALPRDTCTNSYIQQDNVFMDYICVEKTVVADKCTGTFIPLEPKFGIMLSPGYPNNPAGLVDGCYWAIYPETQEIDVVVHMAYSKESRGDCDSRFLQVQYTLCVSNKSQIIDRFCDEGRVNVKIHSCGTVYITHYPYPAGNTRGNRFLVSYSVTSPTSSEEAYARYAYKCEIPAPYGEQSHYSSTGVLHNIPFVTVTSPTSSEEAYARYAYKCERPAPYGEQSHYSSTCIEEPASTTAIRWTTEKPVLPSRDQPSNGTLDADAGPDKGEFDLPPSNDPWRQVTLLRVVVVNIFLGILIVALIMGLAFVCYRYRTFGRDKRKAASKSNTATTLSDKNSTEMQLLASEDEKSPSSSKTQSASRTPVEPENEPLQTMTSFSAVAPYETTIFHYNRPNSGTEDDILFQDKTGGGVSSFLPHPPLRRGNLNNQNGESAYSSFDGDDGTHDVEYTEITVSDIDPGLINKSNGLPADVQEPHNNHNDDISKTIRDALHHYKINDDEYAVVVKPSEQRNTQSSSQSDEQLKSQHPVTTSDHVYINCSSRGSGHTKGHYSGKPVAHIHPVPDDDQSTVTTMHVIPEHDCLLHKIPPPPPPAKLPPDHEQWGPPSHGYTV